MNLIQSKFEKWTGIMRLVWNYEGDYFSDEIWTEAFEHPNLPSRTFKLSVDDEYLYLSVYGNQSFIITFSVGYETTTVVSSATLDFALSIISGNDSSYVHLQRSSELRAILNNEGGVNIFLELEITSIVGKELVAPNKSALKWENIMSDGMHKLFEEQTYTDVTLKIGSDKIKAHRVVLCIASPVFRKCLEAGMSESLTNEINVAFSADIFKKFLKMIYCNHNQLLAEDQLTELSVDDLIKLYEITDFYQVDHLRKFVETFISRKLHNENLVEVLCSNVARGSKTIVEACLDFIRGSSLQDIKDWNKIRGLEEIMNLIFKNLCYISGQSTSMTE